MPMPEHRDWKALRTRYGVPPGAVKGVNVGKLLDDPNDPSRAKLSALAKTILIAAKKVAKEAQAKALV